MRKKNWTRETMFPIIDEYETGNVKRIDFLREKKINKDVFTYWRTKWRKAKGMNSDNIKQKEKPKFLPINPSLNTEVVIKFHSAEIITTNQSSLVLVLKSIKDVG